MRVAMRRLCFALVLTELPFAMVGHAMPSPDAGPHVNSGWDQTIRLMHLYTEQDKGSFISYHLRMNDDGTVDGSLERSAHSLLEIRAVAPGVVAIKGYRSGRYLCMERDGKLLGSLSYNEADCSFTERLLSGTYNLYWSEKYGAAVSLSSRRQRAHTRGRPFPPLSQFLPIRNTLPLRLVRPNHSRETPELDSLPSSVIQTNSMDPLDFTYEAT
ncbi:fibroblast growth factor 19 [Carcharodon carcharias]|uniref:fibroblast growth factor 19 n=1 Tax=Carcharodon carcharias TaxID=13397 RepID=UPI001B7F1B01|nr:fibroblast growth factor 19 [Carcharodon carcharias]